MPSTPNYGSSGMRYYKESSSTKKNITSSQSSGRRYPTTSERYYESKKPQGQHSSSSMYHSQLPPALPSSSSHRYYTSSSGATHGERLHHSSTSSTRQKIYESSVGGGSVSRDPRRPTDYRKYYEKTSSSGSGIRRVPPPLTPPGPGLVPLMKVPVSSSSRYRQAPPEDHNHSYKRSSGSHSHSQTLAREKIASLRKATQRTAESVTNKIRKRAAIDVRHGGSPAEGETKRKRKDDTLESGQIVEEEIIEEEEIERKVEKVKKEKDKEDDPENAVNDKKEKENTEVETKPERDEYANAILKLRCSYCDVTMISFRDFSYHLRSYQHGKVMTAAVSDMKKKLSKLRQTQRDKQKTLEKSEDGKKTLSDTVSYCRVCELNFRTDPKEHEADEIHNELKGLVHPNCETCKIEFRVWKVYLYHSVALEHVKRIALQELKEREEKGENSVKGTNLSEEELGLDLIEQRTVFYCIPCVRYFPIRDDLEEKESKLRHCMTISHIKFVEEYRDRMKRLAKKQEDAEAAAKKKEEEKSANDATGDLDNEADGDGVKDNSKDDADGHDGQSQSEEGETVKVEKEEEDEDEIQLHAEEDDTVVTTEEGD